MTPRELRGQRAVEVGNRIRAAREHHGLSQTELGALIGMNQSTIGRIEQGRVGMDIDRLFEIAAAVHVKVVTLLKDLA